MRKLHIILSLALSASVASFAQEAAASQSLPAPRVGDVKAVVAVANKLARIIWAVWKYEIAFQAQPAVAAA